MRRPEDTPDPNADSPDLERLRALFQSAGPPEPSEAEWAGVLRRVERDLRQARRRPRWPWWGLAGTAAAVAMIVITLGVNRQPPPAVEPFAVAADDDVDVISVDASGAAAVVVGRLPLREPIVLMDPGDVTLKGLERDPAGQFPEVRLQPGSDESPMILGPVAAGNAP